MDKSSEVLYKILNTIDGISIKLDHTSTDASSTSESKSGRGVAATLESERRKREEINDLIERQNELNKEGREGHEKKLKQLDEEAELKKEQDKENTKAIEDQIKADKEAEELRIKRNEKIKASIVSLGMMAFNYAKKIGKAYLDQDNAISKLTANYALSRTELNHIKNSIFEASVETTLIGVKTEDLVKLQQNYTNEIGRSIILSKDSMVQISTMAQATGLGVEGMSSMVAQMELFGIGVEGSYGHITNITKEAKASGVSLSVATKNFEENLKIANTYTFKSGIQGVREMTVLSTKLRVNMGDIASFADKVSNPEGAIQTAASLQVLGGSFAAMADPLNLLYQGIHDMEGLTNTYVDMIQGLADVNKKTGEVTIGGPDRIRMKAAAEAAGLSYENMVNTVRTKAKRDAIDTTLKLNPVINTDDEETKNLIASLAQFKEGVGFTVNVKGQDKLVTKLDKTDLKFLQPKDSGDLLSRLATNAMGIKEQLDNILEALQQKIISWLFPRVIQLLENTVSFFNRISRVLTGKGSDEDSDAVGGAGLQGGKMMATAGIRGMSKNIMKTAGKASLKGVSKFIPVLGSVIDAGFAINDLMNGDTVSAAYNGAAAVAGLADLFAPGAGRAMAFGIDAANVARKAGVFDGGAGINTANNLYHGTNSFDSGNDVLLPSKGKPVLLNEKDDVFAMKEGGAIMEALSPSNNVMSNFTSVEKSRSGVFQSIDHKPVTGEIKLNINGNINLTSGGSSAKINIDELLKNKAFVREITREISNQLNRDSVGGKYMGGLTDISLR